MDLNTLCFLLFGLLFTGFLVLDGLDFGVGMLLGAGKTDIERQALIQTIAPVWEGNQVWLIVAAGLLFAVFPHVYATLFSGLYLTLFIVLVALLLRGLAIELHNKEEYPAWRRFCYWSVFLGSLVPALVWGIALGSLLAGLPIDSARQYSGSFLALFTPYSLLSGLTYMLLFVVQGAIYLAWRLEAGLALRLQQSGLAAVSYAMAAVAGLGILTVSTTTAGHKGLALLLAAAALGCLYGSRRSLGGGQYLPGLALSSLAIIAQTASLFMGLYPRLLVSSLDARWSLDIYNAAASPLTLRLITTLALIVLPVTIACEVWKFYVFRRPVSLQAIELAPQLPRLRRLREKLTRSLTYASCLADALDKTGKALAGTDGAIINKLTARHRTLLFGKRCVCRRPAGQKRPVPGTRQTDK